MWKEPVIKLSVFGASVLGVCAAVYQPPAVPSELANRIPEAAPYVTREAGFFPPPYEEYWKGTSHPGQCESCHQRIFDEWRGSMMANAWRDPVWRGAFLLSARQTSTHGDCDTPEPPDGTPRARLNPFARESGCSSRFDLGDSHQTFSRPGSLLDGFCSRCHMPSNYLDNVPLHRVGTDAPSGLEHGRLDEGFHPTSDDGTGTAFATVDAQFRNTDSGKSGVFCAICHSIAETRDMPYHNLARAETPRHPEYTPALGRNSRARLVPGKADTFSVPDPAQPNLGYAVGAGGFRLSPHAIGFPERLGPLAARAPMEADHYLEGVFREPLAYEQVDSSKHEGYHHVLLTRAELCASCHDVTNPLPIKNRVGKWVGGFPIERTYMEWLGSRYADRPGNTSFDPRFKRDCQTCHMQQDYGQPGTAQTLYSNGAPLPVPRAPVADGGIERPHFTHHFVGGNAYIPSAIGASLDKAGTVQPYPKLSAFSFSSADESSPYHNAYWTDVDHRGPMVQQSRLAWDRLRHVLDLEVSGPRAAAAGTRAPLTVRVTNSGSGHKFPTGFPEGRVAWLAVRAFDLSTGQELDIHDSVWKRTSRGVGGLTAEVMDDPNFPNCWKLPPGSPDPYAVQFKAVASLGDGCPTLDLAYAHALNLVVNDKGQPVDPQGRVIDRRHPRGQPQFEDRDGDGDVYDDSFLSDTRLDPLPRRGAHLSLDRYSVVIPPGSAGPVAVTVAVYYQSVEAIAAQKLLGNLADTDQDFRIEPCVLGGPCDGRTPSGEPAAVEGSPPVPIEVRSGLIQVGGAAPRPEPTASIYPADGAKEVYRDVVVKVSFSEPVSGLDATTFTLYDDAGDPVPASVDQIGDGTWALFPHPVFLKGGETYAVRVAANVCGFGGNCTRRPLEWLFTTAPEDLRGRGDTRVAYGFPPSRPAAPAPPTVTVVHAAGPDAVVIAFSEPVMNVTSATVSLAEASCAGPAIPGRFSSNPAGDQWTFRPQVAFRRASYCVRVTQQVYDLEGQGLARPVHSMVTPPAGPAPKPSSHN
jgi:hypothetical protein